MFMSILRKLLPVQCLLILVWLFIVPMLGHAGDLFSGEMPVRGEDLLRVPVTQWVQLTVDVEEYRPLVEYVDHSSSVTRSLAILPSLRVVAPNQHFTLPWRRIGTESQRFTPQTAVSAAGIEESLVLRERRRYVSVGRGGAD
jgi:hypothetical protein